MLTSELIDFIIDDDKTNKRKKAGDYINYFRAYYTHGEVWLGNNCIRNRIRKILFENPYMQSGIKIKSRVYNTLIDETELNIEELINDAKKWDRRMRQNLGIKKDSEVLEYSVLLATTFAKKIRGSEIGSLETFICTMKRLSEIINIDYSIDTMSKICPYNFSKGYSDWISIINSENCENFNEFLISSYDILCCTIFMAIWHINRAEKDAKDREIIFSQFKKYITDCANDIFTQNRNIDEINQIKEKIESLNINKKKNNIEQLPIKIEKENELYRNPNFLRQANLYKKIDDIAIYKALNDRDGNLSVLDLGCGDGEVTGSRFGRHRRITHIIAIDKDKKQLDIAAEKIKEYGIENRTILLNKDMNEDSFVASLTEDLRELGIERVDIIFAALSLHYCNDPKRLVKELSDQLLTDGGFFIIREVDDDTKIYYSEKADSHDYIKEAADEYKKIFGFTDRNCARKVYSWLVNAELENIELFYDVIDTCNKNRTEKNDLFYIMAGFRGVRAEKFLNTYKESEMDEDKYKEYVNSCNKIIDANDKLIDLLKKDDFWFCAVNYTSIGKKHNEKDINAKVKTKKDIELMFIRHAESHYEEETGDYYVNDIGKKQIEQLQTYLKDIEIDTIYCSSMERAIETAQPIAMDHRLDLNIFEELNEIDRGSVTTDDMWGMFEDYYLLWKKHKSDLEFPNGENGEDVWLRAKCIIDRIIEESKESKSKDRVYRACIFTHAGTIRSIICGMIGVPQTNRYQIIEQVDNCSITTIRINCNTLNNKNTSNPTVVKSLNDTSFMVKIDDRS